MNINFILLNSKKIPSLTDSGQILSSTAEYKTVYGPHIKRETVHDTGASFMKLQIYTLRGIGRISSLVSEIIRECLFREHQGIICYFPIISPELSEFCKYLCAAAELNGISLYLPPEYRSFSKKSKIFISNDWDKDFYNFCSRYVTFLPKKRLVFDLSSIETAFTLPLKTGKVLPFVSDVFFSEEFCSNYAVKSENGDLRFSFFDNRESFRKKLEIIENLGINEVFISEQALKWL